jgi:secreted trypsin-like serine protease
MLKTLCLSLLALSTHALTHTNDTQGNIIGGQIITNTSYPFMASLAYYGEFMCGGSLIAPDWVLTAAHCVLQATVLGNDTFLVPLPAANITVRIGSSEHSRGGQVYQVMEAIPHPQYVLSGIRSHDMALVRLNATSNATTVKLLANGPPPKDTSLNVLGWGVNNTAVRTSSDKLKQVTLKQVDDGMRRSALSINNMPVTDDYLAAGGIVGESACYGDSGGPLLVSGDGYVQAALVSFGVNALHKDSSNRVDVRCARQGDVGFYYRVDRELAWIQQTINVPVEAWTVRGNWQTSSASRVNHFLLNWLW